MAKEIDVTPTWSGVLPMLLTAYESGNVEARRVALDELKRAMATLDRFVEKERAAIVAEFPSLGGRS